MKDFISYIEEDLNIELNCKQKQKLIKYHGVMRQEIRNVVSVEVLKEISHTLKKGTRSKQEKSEEEFLYGRYKFNVKANGENNVVVSRDNK